MNQLGPRAGDLRPRELRTQRALMAAVKSCVLLADAGGVLYEDSHELFQPSRLALTSSVRFVVHRPGFGRVRLLGERGADRGPVYRPSGGKG